MADLNLCHVCKKQAEQKCGGCQNVYYCCKDHQKADWKQHKKNCQPFKISSNHCIGRYLVATRDLKENEIILKEKPLIYGPSQETLPVCLGCNQEISTTNYRPCSKCGWPMCSDNCETNPCHLPECHYFANSREKSPIDDFCSPNPFYQCIILLRCLYQKKHNPCLWAKLNKLESHCAERKITPRYRNEKALVTHLIDRICKLQNDFSVDEIMKICGVIMVNAHEVPLSEPPYIAIYEKTSMFENDCSSNCSKSFTSAGEILITSGCPIKKDNHLSICYADPLWSTDSRRSFLYETKFFWCSCKRCSDPTEFGTNFSAVTCQNGKCDGYLLPKTFLSEDMGSWNCSKCNYSVSNDLVITLSKKIGNEVSNLDKSSIVGCKAFLHKLRNILPLHNFQLVDVKLALSQLIGQFTVGGLINVSDEDLKLKELVCRELIELTGVLIPSEKRVRGLLLFELHAALAEWARRKSNPEQAHLTLMESKTYLLQSIELLKFEPQILPEGKIYEQALKNLQNITNLLNK